jgi:hypothetical protein
MPLLWFVGLENGSQLGRLHLHSLLCNTRDLSLDFLERSWTSGFSRIVRFVPGRGATHYVTKYVTKELLDYDISPNLDAALKARERQRRLFGADGEEGQSCDS